MKANIKLKRFDIRSDKEFDNKKHELSYWHKAIKYIFKKDNIITNKIKKKNITLMKNGTCVVLKIQKKEQAFIVKIFALESWRLQGNYLKEVEMYQVVGSCTTLKDISPKLYSYGKLFTNKKEDEKKTWKNWEFPYLVESFREGKSLPNLVEKVNGYDMMNLAGFLGYHVAKIHSLDTNQHLKKDSKIGSKDKKVWKEFLENHYSKALKKNRKYCGLPKKFHEQFYKYLPEKETLLKKLNVDEGERKLSFLHADLCDENVLLLERDKYVKDNTNQIKLYGINKFSEINYIPSAIIDFGDSKIGDPMYDFVAIFLSTLRCDKILLRIFLYYYNKSMIDAHIPSNLPPPERFSYIAMCYTLLNESPALKSAIHFRPELANLDTLEEIEKHLWDFNYFEEVPEIKKKN